MDIMKRKTFNGVVGFIGVNIANNRKCGGAVEIVILMLKVVRHRSIQYTMIDLITISMQIQIK